MLSICGIQQQISQSISLFIQTCVKISTSGVAQFFSRNPTVWKGFISGSLFSVADLFAQKFIEGKQTIDKVRNLNFLIIGLCWEAPIIELWYSKILPKITSRYLNGFQARKKLALRILIDALVFGPTSYSGFYIFKSFLQKGSEVSSEEISDELVNKLPKTMLADWMMWIPVNILNFRYVPVGYQGLCVGLCTFFFNMILSKIAFSEENTPSPKLEESFAVVNGEKFILEGDEVKRTNYL